MRSWHFLKGAVIEIEILLDKYQITDSNVILGLSFYVGDCFMFVLRDIPEDSLF